MHDIAPEQFGFMPDEGTGIVIFVLRMLVERFVEKQNMFMFVLFTFDMVQYKSLTSLYWNQTAVVRRDVDIGAWMSIKQRVR